MQDRFIVTARKYRPQTFADLVSQLHVSETIRNAIVTGRLAHAYLFSGPRGVGKTTCARLLAKSINCTASLAERERGEACRKCDSCMSFEEGRSMNIIEIDAASNNSVDDIRALRDKVIIPPQGAKKKVYIIDEVHMLSNAAFNALLKTLEEPPSHALFIFATTEPHKVLPTILSRCQRFDFRRISVQDVVLRLKEICQLEGFTADDESLVLIAQKGDGALRDSLSVFDQSIALCGTALRYDELAKALGVIAVDQYFFVTDLVKTQNSAAVFTLIHELMTNGGDYQEFMVGLSEHLRNLLVAITTKKADMIEASETVQQRYLQVANEFQEADVLRLLHLAAEGEQALKTSPQPRLRLEITLLKMVTMPQVLSIAALLHKIEQLGNGQLLHLDNGQRTMDSAPQLSVVSHQPTENKNTDYRLQTTDSKTIENKTQDTRHKTQDSKPTSNLSQNIFGTPALQKKNVAPPMPMPTQVEVPRIAEPVMPLQTKGDGANVLPSFAPTLTATPQAPQVAPPSHIAPLQATSQIALTVDDFNRIFFELSQDWDNFLMRIKKFRIAIYGMLQQAKPAHANREGLHFAVPDVFHEEMLTQQRHVLSQQIATHLNVSQSPNIRFFVQAEIAEAAHEVKESQDPFQQLQKLSQTNPVVRTLLDTFGGEIVW